MFQPGLLLQFHEIDTLAMDFYDSRAFNGQEMEIVWVRQNRFCCFGRLD